MISIPQVQSSTNVLDDFVARANREHVPLSVHLDLTYRCDLACVHCYLEERKKAELTLPEIESVLDDLVELGTLELNLSGGDVFVRPDAMDIIRAAAKRRFYLRMITHAGHITEDIARELGSLGFGFVEVSIYSSQPATHDRVTKVPGSLLKTLRGISALRRYGIRVRLKGIVMNLNPQLLLELPILAAKYDCEYAIYHSIRAARETHIAAGRPSLQESDCNDLRRLTAELADRVNIVRQQQPHIRSRADLQVWDPRSNVCSAGRSRAYISPDGEVHTCSEWEESGGNIRDSSFADIWRDADVFKFARQLTRGQFKGCTDCAGFSVCSLCPGQAARETANPAGSAPTTCTQTEALLAAFPADPC